MQKFWEFFPWGGRWPLFPKVNVRIVGEKNGLKCKETLKKNFQRGVWISQDAIAHPDIYDRTRVSHGGAAVWLRLRASVISSASPALRPTASFCQVCQNERFCGKFPKNYIAIFFWIEHIFDSKTVTFWVNFLSIYEFCQNGNAMWTQFWVKWGSNGDPHHHKWGPKSVCLPN